MIIVRRNVLAAVALAAVPVTVAVGVAAHSSAAQPGHVNTPTHSQVNHLMSANLGLSGTYLA